MKRIAGIAVCVLTLVMCAAANAAKLSMADRALFQATMQQSIDYATIDGAYLHLNATTGVVKKIYPAKNHVMILHMGQHFVLCTEFRNAAGKNINVDFYIARKKQTFVVFHTAVDDRKSLMKMML